MRLRPLRLRRALFRDEEKELTKSEYTRLVSAAQQQGAYRLSLVIQTICATGIRVSKLRFITVEAVALGRAEADCTDQNCIVIMSVQGRSFGAVVDCVCNVETILPEEICLPPQQDDRKTNYLTGIAKREAVILLVDADYLLTACDLERLLDASDESARSVSE